MSQFILSIDIDKVPNYSFVDFAISYRKWINAENEPIPMLTIEDGIQKLGYYHVLLTIFNLLVRNVLFTGKLMALTCSILGTYYVILTREASYMLIIFFGALSIQAIAFYMVIFQKLVEVPHMLASLKNHCNMMVNKKDNWITPREKEILQYQIQVVPTTGIKEAGFRTLRSETMLDFVGFYVNNVISLLLM